MIEPLAKRVHDLGWHVQIHMRGEQIAAAAELWPRLASPIVFDHMGRLPQPARIDHPAFGVIRRLIDQGRTWVKVSGAYLDTKIGGPSYADATTAAQALCAPPPERVCGAAIGRIRPRRRSPTTPSCSTSSPRGRPTRRRVVASSSAIRKRCTVSPHRAEPARAASRRPTRTERNAQWTSMQSETRASRRMPPESFTGTVWQDPIIERRRPRASRSARVSFEARRAHRLARPPARQTSARSSPASAASSSGADRCVRSAPRHGVDRARREALARRLRPSLRWFTSRCRRRLAANHVTWMEHVHRRPIRSGRRR